MPTNNTKPLRIKIKGVVRIIPPEHRESYEKAGRACRAFLAKIKAREKENE